LLIINGSYLKYGSKLHLQCVLNHTFDFLLLQHLSSVLL